MSDLEKAKWMAMGYKVKVGARKMAHELADWDFFKLTFGFYQWRQRSKPTDEQLACFEEGFRHIKIP